MNITMNKFFAIASILAMGPTVASAAPQFNSANGHYYEVIQDASITWNDAKSAADTATHLGVSGHLATITLPAESIYIETLRTGLNPSEFWIGGSQAFPCPSGSSEPKCGWTWENGEGTFPGANVGPEYTNWISVEPNDNYGPGTENHLTTGLLGDSKWNDEGTTPTTGLGNIGGYIIEWDTVPPMANDDPINPANSGETIKIDVLLNDDAMGQEITSIVITSAPSDGGTAVPVLCSSVPPLATTSKYCVNYTSAAVFGGLETFEYKIYSGDLVSGEATVTIQVDGSVSVTPMGPNIEIFGGPENGVPLLATGELAGNSDESSLNCGCKIRDPRVYKRTRRGVTTFKHRWWQTFDIGAAINDPSLASPECLDLPSPGPGKLKISPAFSVHTNPEIAKKDLTLDDFAFGLCLVETGVQWSGVNHFDINALGAAGYEVDCKIPNGGVGKQPLTLGLTTFPEEFTAPYMRPVTIECDPRGAARWSTWYFTPNATHLPRIVPSRLYVQARFWVLRGMLFAMGQDGAVETAFLDSIKSLVRNAQRELRGFRPPTAAEIQASIDTLDQAAFEVLDEDPVGTVYPGSGVFPNPKGELASHVLALRYAVCSEQAHVNDLGLCKVPDGPGEILEGLLPPLPGTP